MRVNPRRRRVEERGMTRVPFRAMCCGRAERHQRRQRALKKCPPECFKAEACMVNPVGSYSGSRVKRSPDAFPRIAIRSGIIVQRPSRLQRRSRAGFSPASCSIPKDRTPDRRAMGTLAAEVVRCNVRLFHSALRSVDGKMLYHPC
jgi:hypothetical protein